MSWVMNRAPVENHGELAVLYALADRASDDGTAAWPSQKWIAYRARCTDRTVRNHLSKLEERGLIRRGDQNLVSHLPSDRRPVVWNLNLSAIRGDAEPDVVSYRRRGEAPKVRAEDSSGRKVGANTGGKSQQIRPETGFLQTIPSKPPLGEGVGVGDSQTVADDKPLPSPDSFDSSRGDSPADWCTPGDPRCLKHVDLPRHEVPACHGCQAVREWFAEQQAEELARERQRAAQCRFCGGSSRVSARNGQGQLVERRCDHVSAPVDAPREVGHREVSDPARRRAMIAESLNQRKAC